MHNKHIMLDIETLSTQNDAAIIAIGAVEFDLEEILQEKIWLINPQLASGRRDISTLEWWASQNRLTTAKVWDGFERENVVAGELFNWMTQFRDDSEVSKDNGHWIWAGPNTFDLTILKSWYTAQNMILPFDWRAGRDLTTLSRVADQLGIDYSGEWFDGFEAHNPISDCIKQARRCQIILKCLGSVQPKVEYIG